MACRCFFLPQSRQATTPSPPISMAPPTPPTTPPIMLLLDDDRPPPPLLPSELANAGESVAVVKPTVLATTRSVVITELWIVPSVVKIDVYVDGSVVELTIALVMVVVEDKVERLMVEEPTTTMSLELSLEVDTGTTEADVKLDVIVDPTELVSVVGITMLAVEDDEAVVETDAATAVEESGVGVADVESGVDELSAVLDDEAGSSDVVAIDELVDTGVAEVSLLKVVDDDTPVAATCLFFGMIPPSVSSFATEEKPNGRKENMLRRGRTDDLVACCSRGRGEATTSAT
nr:hypothetical protein CFP56_03203 [Quercus suber]